MSRPTRRARLPAAAASTAKRTSRGWVMRTNRQRRTQSRCRRSRQVCIGAPIVTTGAVFGCIYFRKCLMATSTIQVSNLRASEFRALRVHPAYVEHLSVVVTSLAVHCVSLEIALTKLPSPCPPELLSQGVSAGNRCVRRSHRPEQLRHPRCHEVGVDGRTVRRGAGRACC